MKVKSLTALAGAAIMLACVSCGSTPTEEPVPPAPVEEPKPEPAPVEEPKEEPKNFSDANSELMARLEEARNRAVASGAKNAYPSAWKAAESEYEKLKADMAADNTADYSARIKDLTVRYDSLDKAAQAQAMKKRVDGLDSNDIDKAAYKTGEDALAKYDADGDSASADTAYKVYKSILDKAFRAMAGRERNAALEAKKNADSVKAGVSRKDEYGKAAELFKKADASYVTQNTESAYQDYQASKKAFTSLYESVSKARAAAQAAIERAKQKASETATYAQEADGVAPLGESQVSGIEAEDAVLLEADELANPEEAVIDVSNAEAETEVKEAIAAEEAASKTAGAQEAQ